MWLWHFVMALALSFPGSSETLGSAAPLERAVMPAATLERGEPAAIAESVAVRTAQHPGAAHVCCDGDGGFAVCRGRDPKSSLLASCIDRHEEDHLEWFVDNLPRACEARPRGARRFDMTRQQYRDLECRAYRVEYRCLTASRAQAGGRRHGAAELLARQRQLAKIASERFACPLDDGRR